MTQILSAMAGRVPRRVRLSISGALGVLIYRVWRSKRCVTIANMAQVLGRPTTDPQVRALALRSWRNYGRYVSEFFYLPNTTASAVVTHIRDTTPPPGWRGRLDMALARGRGVLVPTAHFGNWDAAGVVCGSHTPLHVIAETFPDQRLNALVQRQRAALGMTVVPMERTPRRILRVLQEHGTVATPVDRPLPAGEGVPITFFGRRCYVPGGIAQLALKTGAAIAPGFCWYDEEYSPAYCVYVAAPIVPIPTGERQADIIALTQRIYDVIADLIRAHPAQWYMFRPFWPDEPAAAEGRGPAGAETLIALTPRPAAPQGIQEQAFHGEEPAL